MQKSTSNLCFVLAALFLLIWNGCAQMGRPSNEEIFERISESLAPMTASMTGNRGYMPSGDRGYVPPPPPPSSNGDDIAAPILSDLFSNGLNTQAQPNREAAAAEAEVRRVLESIQPDIEAAKRQQQRRRQEEQRAQVEQRRQQEQREQQEQQGQQMQQASQPVLPGIRPSHTQEERPSQPKREGQVQRGGTYQRKAANPSSSSNTERDWMTDPQQAPPYPVPARPQQMQQAAGDGQEQPKSLFSGLESLRNFDPEVLEARLKKEERLREEQEMIEVARENAAAAMESQFAEAWGPRNESSRPANATTPAQGSQDAEPILVAGNESEEERIEQLQDEKEELDARLEEVQSDEEEARTTAEEYIREQQERLNAREEELKARQELEPSETLPGIFPRPRRTSITNSISSSSYRTSYAFGSPSLIADGLGNNLPREGVFNNNRAAGTSGRR